MCKRGETNTKFKYRFFVLRPEQQYSVLEWFEVSWHLVSHCCLPISAFPHLSYPRIRHHQGKPDWAGGAGQSTFKGSLVLSAATVAEMGTAKERQAYRHALRGIRATKSFSAACSDRVEAPRCMRQKSDTSFVDFLCRRRPANTPIAAGHHDYRWNCRGPCC